MSNRGSTGAQRRWWQRAFMLGVLVGAVGSLSGPAPGWFFFGIALGQGIVETGLVMIDCLRAAPWRRS